MRGPLLTAEGGFGPVFCMRMSWRTSYELGMSERWAGSCAATTGRSACPQQPWWRRAGLPADPLLAAAAGRRPGLHNVAARAGRPSPAGPLRRATNRRCRGLTASGRAAPSRRTDQTGGNGPAPDGTLGAQFPRERGGIPVSPLRPRQVFRKGFAAWSTCSISSALSNASGAGARLRAVRIAAACRASI